MLCCGEDGLIRSATSARNQMVLDQKCEEVEFAIAEAVFDKKGVSSDIKISDVVGIIKEKYETRKGKECYFWYHDWKRKK